MELIEHQSTLLQGRRFLQIQLYKAVPMQGMFCWWQRPLTCFPEQEVDGSYDHPTNAKKKEEFQKAWEEAHELFKESKQKGGNGSGVNPFGPELPSFAKPQGM